MSGTKKVGETGRHGVRGGVSIRRRVLLATKDLRAKKVCPKCKRKAVKRIAGKGIYECSHCKAKTAGGAYNLRT
ncbi:MAG: 50S ribosomal protein L37ae [archaeon]